MLEQRQVQTQMMTLNQRQALEVLAMNTMELREFLEQEQLENPLLEVDFAPGQGDLVDIAQWLQGSQPQVEDGVYREEEPFPRREPAAGEERTYREDLKEQLYSLGVGAGRLELAERLVELIDSRGFLPYTDLELCQLLRCSPGACQTALRTIRALEPPGVGSRDLGEFLTRQLAEQGLLSPALTEICSSFLPQLAEGGYREIAAALGLELAAVRQCAQLIATLRHSPLAGSQNGSPAEYILPDLTVHQGEKGLAVTVNHRLWGQVSISGYYKSYLQSAESPEVRSYLREKIQRARWVMAAIEQRQRTMLQLGEELLRFQRNFFLGGDLAAVTQPAVGRESVKGRILQLIREEDPKHPLSDESLRSLLEQSGLELSRRTVAKYRTECGIRSATDRRA